ncbi:hypothetical protein O3P69_004333 [Scylla paramamosain]|uniref:CCHC-type domain-containing protein n=1 Tax=Scylla paramamosain TaxID=85552 RepID=A0AAW0UCS8_SCYPA
MSVRGHEMPLNPGGHTPAEKEEVPKGHEQVTEESGRVWSHRFCKERTAVVTTDGGFTTTTATIAATAASTLHELDAQKEAKEESDRKKEGLPEYLVDLVERRMKQLVADQADKTHVLTMPHGRKKAEHRGREETAEHGTSSSPEPDTFLAGASSHLTHAHPSPDQQHSPMDFYAFLTYMKERDDAARVEREEEAARYRAELAEQKREDAARFEALLSRLAPPPASSPAPRLDTLHLSHHIHLRRPDEELVQKIVALDASSTLLDVVTLCRAYEATRSAATAIRASPAARAVSQYKKGKKATHKSKAESQRVAPTSSSPCSACGKQQHGPKGCPSAAAICSGCGKTGHWSHTEKCPARNVQCNSCNRYGHFEHHDATAASVITLHAIESLASEDAQASPDQAVTRDLTLEGLRRATLDDPTYSDLLHFVKEGFPTRYDAHAKPLVPLNLDTQVRLQDPTTKRWDTVGIVMGVGKSRDYLVKMPSGRVLWRNRRLLRPVPPVPMIHWLMRALMWNLIRLPPRNSAGRTA